MKYLWYLFVRYDNGNFKTIKIKADSKYDIFAFIGYYYSVVEHTEKIERIDYELRYVSETIAHDYDCNLIRLYYSIMNTGGHNEKL